MVTRILTCACAAAIMSVAVQARAQTIIPAQGQAPEQIQADTVACQAQQQSTEAQQSADAASKQAFSACMGSRGYTTGP